MIEKRLILAVLVVGLLWPLWLSAQENPSPEQWAPDMTVSVEKLFGVYTYWRQTDQGYESGFLEFAHDHTWTLVSHFDLDFDRHTDRYTVIKGTYAVGHQADGRFAYWLTTEQEARRPLQNVVVIGGHVESFTVLGRSFKRRAHDGPFFVMEGNQPDLAEQLEVHTEPAGAGVFIEGNRMDGTTPLTIKKPRAGVPLKVRVVLSGYRPQERTVELEVGEKRKIDFTLLTGESGLRVTSLPRVKVGVDGQWLGSTPLEVNDLPAGQHTLSLINRALGIQHEEVVTLNEGETLERDFRFTGRLIIDVGRQCKIYRRGRLAGQTPFDQQVPIGRHLLTLIDEQGEKRQVLVEVPLNGVVEVKKPFESLRVVE